MIFKSNDILCVTEKCLFTGNIYSVTKIVGFILNINLLAINDLEEIKKELEICRNKIINSYWQLKDPHFRSLINDLVDLYQLKPQAIEEYCRYKSLSDYLSISKFCKFPEEFEILPIKKRKCCLIKANHFLQGRGKYIYL